MNLRKLEYNKYKPLYALEVRLELPFTINITDKHILNKVYDKLKYYNIVWNFSGNLTRITDILNIIVRKNKTISHCSKDSCRICDGFYTSGNKCDSKKYKNIYDYDFIKETTII